MGAKAGGAPGVEKGVFRDDAGAADAKQRAQDLGRLVAALRDAGPQPAIARACAHRTQRRCRLPHNLHITPVFRVVGVIHNSCNDVLTDPSFP